MPAHVSSTVKKNTVMLRQEHGNPLCAKNDVLRIYRLEIPCCQRKTLQNKLQTILYLVCDTCPAKYKSIGIQYCMLHGFCGGNSIYSTHRSDLLRSAHIRQIRSDHQIIFPYIFRGRSTSDTYEPHDLNHFGRMEVACHGSAYTTRLSHIS